MKLIVQPRDGGHSRPNQCPRQIKRRSSVAGGGTRTLLTNDHRSGTRRRILLALRLIDDAMRREEGFLGYWTALEVVCAGGANKIKATLAKVYGIKYQNAAAEATRLSVFSRWRHDYVHHGVRPNLNADVGRYLPLLFLDLLRHELGLPSRRYVAALQAARGYDFSSIGLARYPKVE
jgi:hypothetical protein